MIKIKTRRLGIGLKITLGFTAIVLILFFNIIIFSVSIQSYYNNYTIEKRIGAYDSEIKSIVNEKNIYIQTGDRAHSENVINDSQAMAISLKELLKLISQQEIEKSYVNKINSNLEVFSKSFEEYVVIEEQKSALEDKFYNTIRKLLEQIHNIRNELEAKPSIDSKTLLVSEKLSEIENTILLQSIGEGKINWSTNINVQSYMPELSKIIIDGQVIMNILAENGSGVSGYRIVRLARDYSDILKSYYNFKKQQDMSENRMNINSISIIQVSATAAQEMDTDGKSSLDNLRRKLFALFLFSILLGSAMAYYLSLNITSRMKKLVEATKKISEGNYLVEITKSKHTDELDILATSFLNMVESLVGSRLQIEGYNKHLEETVLIRTKDLQDAKDKLETSNNLLEKEKEQLRILSVTDSLTQLYNRGYIISRLQEEVNRALRYKQKFCVMLIDIDNFKNVNDNYGHIIGDEALKVCSEIFKNCLRETDLLGRYGGDEFLIILPETKIEDAEDVAERIRMEIFEKKFTEGDLGITISAGVCQHKEEDIDQIFHNVDNLLYEAKAYGRNCIRSNRLGNG